MTWASRGALLCGMATISCGNACESANRDAPAYPAELADSEALGVIADWQALPVFSDGRREKQSSTDRERGFLAEIPLWERGNRDMNAFVCRSADADAPAGRARFVYDSERCTEPYVRGVVLSRFEGSGRLARLWLTAGSFREGPADREVLRIWVDDREQAIVDVLLRDAMDGKAGDMFAPPFGLGSTRRMAWYYPLVFSKKLVIALDHLGDDDLYFHQTDVVLDAEPRSRQAAPARLPARDRAIEVIKRAESASGSSKLQTLTLASGERNTVFDLPGPGTIEKTILRVSRAELDALGNVWLTVRWDDAAGPAIDLPLADLFADMLALPEPASGILGSEPRGERQELSLALPMPFSTESVWTLENRGKSPVELELELRVGAGMPAQKGWGHLHVQRFETSARGPMQHPIASLKGRGRLAGVCLAMQGHGAPEPSGRRGHPMEFLEGDEKLRLDARGVLSGTGTEDYFDSSFFFDDGPRASSFAQVWDIDMNTSNGGGRVSACRWHVLGDAIDFTQSLELGIEIGPGLPETLDRYRSVAFIYH